MSIHLRNKLNKNDLVVIHIGTEKTGTTSIQHFLRNNLSNLKSQNVHLLDKFGVPNNRDFVAAFQESMDDWAKRKGIEDYEQKEKFFHGMEKTFQLEFRKTNRSSSSKKSGSLLITSEHFSSRLTNKTELRKLHSFLSRYFHEVKVICFFRPQEEMAISLYSTGLRAASSSKLENSLANAHEGNMYYNFYEIAKAWSEVFGRENIAFRIYNSRAVKIKDIRHQFLDALDSVGLPINKSKLIFDHEFDNQSLSVLRASAYRAINSAVPFWNHLPLKGVNKLNLELKNVIDRVADLDHGKFALDRPGQIQSRFEYSNKQFLEEFMPGERFELNKFAESENELFSLEEVEQIVYGLVRELSAAQASKKAPTLFSFFAKLFNRE